MFHRLAAITSTLFFILHSPAGLSQAAPDREPVDEEVNKFLREQGLEHSQVMEHLRWICDVHGPRLTGSPNLRQAEEWAVKTLGEWGLQNAHLEEWGPFGRGWRLDHFHLDVVGDNPWPVSAWPKAWSPSTNGVVEGDAVLVADLRAEDLSALDLTGKIVLLEGPREVTEPFESPAKRYDAEELLNLADGRRSIRAPGIPPGGNRPAGDAAVAGAPAAANPGGAANAAAPSTPPAPGAQPPSPTPPTAAPDPAAPSTTAAAPTPGAPVTEAAPAAGDPSRENFRAAFQRRSQMLRMIFAKKPLAILDRGSKGDYGTIFVSSVSLPSPEAPEGASGEEARRQRSRGPRPWSPEVDVSTVIPQFTLAVEHYNRISRLLQKGIPVHLSLRLDATFFDGDPMEHNVIAEIPGTDPVLGNQVVMLGAHYDSWHSGTGATDNGAGSAVMMESVRLLSQLIKEKGKAPRRTIRIGLWTGEEEGLLGSRAYVENHFGTREAIKEEHGRLSTYFNLDNGTGKIRGIYLQGNEACAPIFRSWLRPFHDLSASTLTLNNTGGTDHQSFDGVGLPGFQFIQDPVSYDSQTHHSNMDNWDHAVADDLKQAATIIASFAWHAAQREEMLPRKPAPAAPTAGERTGGSQ